MRNSAKLAGLGILATMLFSLTAAAQSSCPMGMQTRYNPSQFNTLQGKGICHLRLWDTQTSWIDLNGAAQGVYNWSTLDTMLNEANTLGVDVLYTFGKVPGWASSNPTDPNCRDGYHAGDCAPPSDVDSGDNYFKGFVTALMQHTGNKIAAFEMWNEPYNPPYWDGTPAQLATMVADGAQIIRAMNPKAIIITPSISVWPNQQVFLQNFFTAAQGRVTFDVFGIHDYTWGGPAEKVVSEIGQAISFQNKMGMQNIPLWGVEGSDKEWSSFTQQQKNDFIARYLTLELNSGSQRHYWYSWNTSTVGGLIGSSGATVYTTVSSWFNGRTPKGCTKTWSAVNNGYAYSCILQDTTAHQVLWITSGSTTYSTNASQYQTTDGVIHQVTGGSVPVNDSPVFILQ